MKSFIDGKTGALFLLPPLVAICLPAIAQQDDNQGRGRGKAGGSSGSRLGNSINRLRNSNSSKCRHHSSVRNGLR
jgi:hypothetical protein